MLCGKVFSFVYTTSRVVKIPNKCLSITHKIISLFVIFYIGVYGLWYCKGYQGTSEIESVVVSKVKGIVTTKYSDAELGVSTPDFYRRVWDASDVVIPSQGDESGGFILLTNIVITPNQTRGTCPESINVEKSKCKTDKDCQVDKVLNLGNGPMTGKCISSSSLATVSNPKPSTISKPTSQKQAAALPTTTTIEKTCEITAWCPVSNDKVPLQGKKALLEDTKDFTVLIKNSIEFPKFGDYYKRRNIMDSATKEYLQSCIYNPRTDPYCPTFKISQIVTGAGDKFESVALTGGVFALKIGWFCSFDLGASIRDCRPKYSFARMDNPNAYVSPGFNFRSAVFHEENRRTLTRNYGLKIVIDVEGEGRKFDSVRLVLAIGAGMGLFAIATSFCDFLLGLFCKLKRRFKWKWLQFYSDDMKYDLTHMCSAKVHKGSTTSTKTAHELDEIKTLQ